MSDLSFSIQLAMIARAHPGQSVRSDQYSLMQALPIACRSTDAERPVQGAALLRQLPAVPIPAEVSTTTGDPARVDHNLPVDHGKSVQVRTRLYRAAPNAGAKRLS